MEEEKVRAIVIVEIMGRPADYAKEALKAHTGQLKNRKNVSVISEMISEPKLIENSDLYTCFSEIEIETGNIYSLIEIIFDYMPSSIEILKPEKLSFNISEANNFLNDLAGRLHKYDEIAKVAQIQNQQLVARLQELEGKLNKDIEKVKEIKKDKRGKKEKKK